MNGANLDHRPSTDPLCISHLHVLASTEPSRQATAIDFARAMAYLCNLLALHRLQPIDLAVFARLYEHYNRKTGKCFPCYRLLANEVGEHQRTVMRSVSRLEQEGIIKKERRLRSNGSGQTSNQYNLVVLFRSDTNVTAKPTAMDKTVMAGSDTDGTPFNPGKKEPKSETNVSGGSSTKNNDPAFLQVVRVMKAAHKYLDWSAPQPRDVRMYLKSDSPIRTLIALFGEKETAELFVWAARTWDGDKQPTWNAVCSQRDQLRANIQYAKDIGTFQETLAA